MINSNPPMLKSLFPAEREVEVTNPKKKASARKKGLLYVREVRKILEKEGYEVEGPGFKLVYFHGSRHPKQVHHDYFGVYDLISFKDCHGFQFHQVSVDHKRSEKINVIIKANKPGFVWGRFADGSSRKIGYKLYEVRDNSISFVATFWLGDFIARKKGKGDDEER